MCPTYSHSRAPIDIRILTVCSPRGCAVDVAYFRYFSSIEKMKKEIIKWRYFHLRLPEHFESCSACSVLSVTHAVTSCSDCPEVLERFVAYVGRAGEQPWNDSESIIIGISSACF